MSDCLKDNSGQNAITLSRCSSPVTGQFDMGCKLLTCCDDTELNDNSLLLTSTNEVDSPYSSLNMHPPLLPSFNITPPKQQRNSAYELAKFVRGSFHVKRAKITHLRRSLSNIENVENDDFNRAAMTSNAEERTENVKKKILEDTTNRVRGSSSNVCAHVLPGNISPFRRVWKQSSLRTPRSDKYALNVKQHRIPCIRCSPSMNASKNNVFSSTTTDSKQCSKTKLSFSNQKMPICTHSEKVIVCPNHGVKSWANSFEHLLQEPTALATFAEFLKLEFSAENIFFWTSCERYRNTENLTERQVQAKQIFQKYLANDCREPVNLDSQTRNLTEEMLKSAERHLFVTAQKQIFHLMKFDSYQRFIRSDLYKNCLQAEEKGQPLPIDAENLDTLLKTNFTQNTSPKLKKSVSNAEDRRRKILLPWHRKSRSKSRDRVDLLNEEINNEQSGHSSNSLNTRLVSSPKPSLLSSTLPPQDKPPTEHLDSGVQCSRSSLPNTLKTVEIGCSLCRVKFCDGATTIVQIKPNETIQQLVERVLEKRGLHYRNYDVITKSHSKAIDLQASTQEIAGEEVEIEQRVTFKLYLPDPKVISVKSKPRKYLHEVVKSILQKYSYNIETVDVLKRDSHEQFDLNQLVTAADGLRLQIVLHKTNNSNNAINYENDNNSMKRIKSKELAKEVVARNTSFKNNIHHSQNNLEAITNSIFNYIIQDKTEPELTDHCSIVSDECSSEASFFDAISNKEKCHSTSMTRLGSKNFAVNKLHYTETNVSSNSFQISNEFNKPIIAKLKAGVKLQVTERVAEKQDELLANLKTRLDNQIVCVSNGIENDQMSAVNLRRVRANLSPVNKTNLNNEFSLSIQRPQPLVRHSLANKAQVNTNSTDLMNHSEYDGTNAANKEPPPLPPKPKVLPTKPANWGFISDQTLR